MVISWFEHSWFLAFGYLIKWDLSQAKVLDALEYHAAI